MKALLNYLRFTPRRDEAKLLVTKSGGTVEVSLGRKSFIINSELALPTNYDVYDFALFGALAVAFRHNVAIEVDLPISSDGAKSVHKINNMIEMWQPRKTYPAPIKLNNIVEMEPSSSKSAGVICLSGGIDSTYAAIEALANRNLSHGVFIAGADFANAQDSGFLRRKERVSDIANKLGIKLFVIETNIRKLGVMWAMSHGLVLASCLTLHAGRFGWGGISADFTPEQEYVYHPWGNNSVLVSALSNTHFPIHHLGRELSRSEKTRQIIEYPGGLASGLSVCFDTKKGGGNCGCCKKCVRTRLNILTSGHELPELFQNKDKLEILIPKLPFSKNQADRLRDLSWMLDIRSGLADGLVKEAVEKYIYALKSKIIPRGRI